MEKRRRGRPIVRKTIDRSDLIAQGYTYHHTATGHGYRSRLEEKIEPYSGRYGRGVLVVRGIDSSTQYHVREYWLMGGAGDGETEE